MDYLQFLNTLENTLERMSVRGRDDAERIVGIFNAIDQQRQMIISSMNKGGEESGRQVDKRTDSGNDSKQ